MRVTKRGSKVAKLNENRTGGPAVIPRRPRPMKYGNQRRETSGQK